MDGAELGREILKAVSRSFYLTLRLLPPGFREPASLAYLLARLSDTIADAGRVEAAVRRELLEQFRVVLSAPGKRSDARSFAERLPTALAKAGLPRGEWDLVLRASDCLEWLDGMDRNLAKLVRRVVGTITEGQAWDLERFEGAGVVRLERDEELERYAYQVAGCVGEFWTAIGFACEPRFSAADREELMEWGANYGKGLQLVNILRDLPEDLERGRCYLPGRDSASPEALVRDAERWRARAREFLADGLRYTAAVRGTRLRTATGLPALLGWRTLDRLDAADWDALVAGVKITRREVKRALAAAVAASVPGVPGSWKRRHRRACHAMRSPQDRRDDGQGD